MERTEKKANKRITKGFQTKAEKEDEKERCLKERGRCSGFDRGSREKPPARQNLQTHRESG